MKKRLTALIRPDQAKHVCLFTFHGLSWRILSKLEGRPNVIAQREQHALIRQLLKGFQLNVDRTAVDGLLTDFSFFVGAQVPADKFRPVSCDFKLFLDIWARYKELKQGSGVYDFDDLIVRARDLLVSLPISRRPIASQLKHLLVDEFQDTNSLQWEFLQLFIPKGENIMVVGDDDQAVYGWRCCRTSP
jgi:DNA helicase-2/ATP-dependent DNA helicase PcrA